MQYDERIMNSATIQELFEIVKDIVMEYLGHEQAGLMVGISDLGMSSEGFVGAYYTPNANMIIMNKRALQAMRQLDPTLYNKYAFYILLHEYIHSIGSYDEANTRRLVYEISNHYFGQQHPITTFSTDMEQFIPRLTKHNAGFPKPEEMGVEFLTGIDRRNTNYIR
jgi:hypothetical protein